MTKPLWLIAEREIRTYVATASFWIALAIGPLIAGAALCFTGSEPAAIAVSIQTRDAALARLAPGALQEAAQLEHRNFAVGQNGFAVAVSLSADGEIVARFANRFPLSLEGRVLFVNTLERDHWRPRALRTPQSAGAAASGYSYDTAALSGFVLTMMLWLVLTGSLGMLLQSIVRERANRALECLLAAASPRDIMLGKLFGVGAISFGLLAGWVGTAAGLSLFWQGGLAASVLSEIAEPTLLVRAIVLYLLGYFFYGSVTIALGAAARDVAAAQNLARPMFAVLLAAFFVALFSALSPLPSHYAWLVVIPLFTPFLLLLRSFAALSAALQIASLLLLTAGAFIAAHIAINGISISGGNTSRSFKNLVSSMRRGIRRIAHG